MARPVRHEARRQLEREQDTVGPRILIVEDDPRIADFMIRGLGKSGFTVEWVTTAAEALDRLVRGGIDVHILDLGLPDMDGLDLQRELIARNIVVPTVVVTARTDPRDRAAAESLGLRSYISKPFAWADLLAAVRAAARTAQS